MAKFGWAYIDCADAGGGGQAAGPTGSLQFLTGANATSGSAKLIFYTASTSPWNADTLVLTGTLVVDGNISASSYTIKDITEIDGTGSTFFGDSNDDIHVRTGSLYVTQVGAPPFFTANIANVKIRHSASLVVESGSVIVHYSASNATTFTISAARYIIGIRAAGNIAVTMPAASAYGNGGLLVIKDELAPPRVGAITLTRAGSDTIDHDTTYELSGTSPAINLYSNGSNWFVY